MLYTPNIIITIIVRYTTLITPSDWCFRIWSFIGIGEILGIGGVLMHAGHEADLYKKVFSMIQILSGAWMMCFGRKFFILSSVILFTMVVSLKVALDSCQLAAIIASWPLPLTLIVVIPVKVHYAFAAVATGLNLNILLVYTNINYNNIIGKEVEYFVAMMTIWLVAGYSLYENINNDSPFYSFIAVWSLSAIADNSKHKRVFREVDKIVNQSIELTCLLLICLLSLIALFKANSPYRKISLVDGALPLSMLPLSLLLFFVLSFHIVIGHAILKTPFQRIKQESQTISKSEMKMETESD